MKIFLPALCLILGFHTLPAQIQIISGKITSYDDRSPLPGIAIQERGTGHGTVSDPDGFYHITVGDLATLIFSYPGYKTMEVAVGEQSVVDIMMESDVTSLQGAVVTGYGTQQKKDITGAVASLTSESFNQGNINDPVQLFQGKLAGVSISKPGSDPNEPFTVRIRGVSTLSANQQPLYVIDGVIGASMANVDPNDIASVDVLKDGSSAAIYGMQGSGGVAVVTTRKGKPGRMAVDVSSYIASDHITRKIPVMTRQVFSQYFDKYGGNLGYDTYWMDEVTRSGITKVNNLAISGGSQQTAYRVSLNYRYVEGILKNSGYDQLNGRFSLQQSAFKGRVQFNMDASSTTRNTNYSFQEALRYAVTYNPTAPIFDPTGKSFTGGPYGEQAYFDYFNPVAIINQNTNDGKRTIINLSGKLEVELIPGLSGSVIYAIQRENELKGQYYSKFAYFRGFNRNGLAIRNTSEAGKDILEMYLSYKRNFNRINLSVTGGYSFQEKQSQGYGITTGNFLSDALGYNALSFSQDLANGLSVLTSFASPDQKLVGFFGRANMSYKKTYLLSVSYRHEGYTGLGTYSKWGDFGSLSGAVILSEKFKVRAGWGMTGALPNGYGLGQTLYSQTTSFGYSNGAMIPIVYNSQASNSNLKWEQKTEINAGVDFTYLNNRLTGSFDIYRRIAQDFVLPQYTYPEPNYGIWQYQNLGKVRTNGLELTLNLSAVQSSNFTWITSLVGSRYKSILLTLYPGTETADGLPEPGSALGAPGNGNTFTVHNINGEQVGTIVGPIFKGVNEFGQPVLDANPYSRLGHGLPTFDLGWSNSLTYKHWDLNFLLRGSFGHSLVNSYRDFYEPLLSGNNVSHNRIQSKYFNPDLLGSTYSSLYVEKAGFLKLDNLALGYNFRLKGGSSFSKLRIYMAGNNLFVITNYSGNDPEPRLVDSGSTDNGSYAAAPNPLAPGIDRRNNYFLARSISLGLNLAF